MVDRDLVLRKIADIDQYLQQLAGYRQFDLDSYRNDWKVKRIVERTLHDYARLDPAIVLRVLHTDLVDIERFRDAVLQII